MSALNRLGNAIWSRLRTRIRARSTHARLLHALDVIPEGVVLFDAEDRYVLWNRQFAEIYAETGHTLVAGGRFEDTLRAGLALRQYPDAENREEDWLRERLAHHAMPQSTHGRRQHRYLHRHHRGHAAGSVVPAAARKQSRADVDRGP